MFPEADLASRRQGIHMSCRRSLDKDQHLRDLVSLYHSVTSQDSAESHFRVEFVVINLL